ILIYAGVSDCDMEKGSLRVDANISLRPAGDSRLGTKTELKNLNSFANVERALELERARQALILDGGGAIEQVTLLFNAGTGQVRPMRSKEESHDYRYFPDPDLPPLVLDQAWIESERAALPELPEAKRLRLTRDYGLPEYDARVLAAERAVADYFEAVVGAGAPAKAAANWVMGEVLAWYGERGAFPVPPPTIADLIAMVTDGTVSLQAARKVLAEIGGTAEAPRAAAVRLGLVQVRDDAALETWVDEVLASSGAEIARYRAGDLKLLGFFVGQVMKKSRGKADPKAIGEILTRKLGPTA
ncbi:MAG: Asp-tRNA(Asn)/Glu-tRNA(Gln) amidotransferase GatCAB subunit B, partial [Gemmatimonadales bacterium]|nr:Asp-tRNA(Asn)/Glu-tRNA(Gln) amidotransferase GatCAB subunit B [Gemmatimonadales bacterium]